MINSAEPFLSSFLSKYGVFLSAYYPLAEPLLFSLKSQKSSGSSIQLNESEDIQQAQQGDSDAFRRLIEKNQSHLSKLLWKFTRDKTDHEELVQETFVQAYLSLHTYKSKAPFQHWLSRIATRAGYRYWKQAKRHSHTSLLDCDWQDLVQSEEPMDPQRAAEIIHMLLAALPPRDRLVLTLRYLEQYSVEQTARQTGWTKSSVKVQTYRAKQKLKKLLENTDIEFEMPI